MVKKIITLTAKIDGQDWEQIKLQNILNKNQLAKGSISWEDNMCQMNSSDNIKKNKNEGISLSVKQNKNTYSGAELHYTGQLFSQGKFSFWAKNNISIGTVAGLFLMTPPPPKIQEWIQEEIDIEFLGNKPNGIQINLLSKEHKSGQNWTKNKYEKFIELPFDTRTDFHKYTIEWAPGKIIWYADDEKIHEINEIDLIEEFPIRKDAQLQLRLNHWIPPHPGYGDIWVGELPKQVQNSELNLKQIQIEQADTIKKIQF